LGYVALYKDLEKSIKVKFTPEQAKKALRGSRGPMIGVYGGTCLETAFLDMFNATNLYYG
jgi:hypothetical protein